MNLAISSAPKARKVFVSRPRVGRKAVLGIQAARLLCAKGPFWQVTFREHTCVTSRECRGLERVDLIMARNKVGYATMSARAELARRVLKDLAQGQPVSTHDAFQLRNWAVHREDSVLTLEEIAHRILDQDEDPKAIAGSMDDAPQTRNWRRVCAEFMMTDLKLAFTFLDIARTSGITESGRRNQENARTAYDAVLRFLPRSLPALSAAERQAIENKLGELKNRLEQRGENF